MLFCLPCAYYPVNTTSLKTMSASDEKASPTERGEEKPSVNTDPSDNPQMDQKKKQVAPDPEKVEEHEKEDTSDS